MPDYKKMYFSLFNAVTDALEAMEAQNYGIAREVLIAAQQAGEERFISGEREEKDIE